MITPLGPAEKLPDLLQNNLRLVFVGTAASTRSAEVGHYYAHPGNRFWRTIHEVGLTSRQYQPHEFKMLLGLGIGLTDLSKSGAGMDHQISEEQIDVASFETKIGKYKPKTIAFTSKKAASFFFRKPTDRILLGRQRTVDDLPEIFVLSSPSGAAVRYWTAQPWRELAAAIDSQIRNQRRSDIPGRYTD